MSDLKLKKQKLLLDLYNSLKQIESQLDAIPNQFKPLSEALAQSLEDSDAYLRQTQPLVNSLSYLRILMMNARDSLQQYCRVCSVGPNSFDSNLDRDSPTKITTKTVRYVIVIKPSGDSYCGYCIDLPECRARGETLEQVRQQLTRVLTSRLNQTIDNDRSLPQTQTIIDYAEIKVPES